MASKFVFSNAVKGTKKKRTENCTPDMDDLFNRIFDVDVDNRITFEEIRRHSVFAKHFPVINEATKTLYKVIKKKQYYKFQEEGKVLSRKKS